MFFASIFGENWKSCKIQAITIALYCIKILGGGVYKLVDNVVTTLYNMYMMIQYLDCLKYILEQYCCVTQTI